MVEKACKNCHRVVAGSICPMCKDSQLTASWKGFIIVSDPAKSEIAKKLNITVPGKYALRLSK
jgi:DNA-directed RNA polymerase subunit E"